MNTKATTIEVDESGAAIAPACGHGGELCPCRPDVFDPCVCSRNGEPNARCQVCAGSGMVKVVQWSMRLLPAAGERLIVHRTYALCG